MKTKQQIIDKRQELIGYEMERLSKKYKKFNVGRDLTPRTWGKSRRDNRTKICSARCIKENGISNKQGGKMIAEITEKGIEINGILINESIFQKEKADWVLVERENQIDHLIDWISENTRESDKFLMKEDLKYLINLKDIFVFSDISTNKLIAKSDNAKEFNNICREILKLHKDLKEEAK